MRFFLHLKLIQDTHFEHIINNFQFFKYDGKRISKTLTIIWSTIIKNIKIYVRIGSVSKNMDVRVDLEVLYKVYYSNST